MRGLAAARAADAASGGLPTRLTACTGASGAVAAGCGGGGDRAAGDASSRTGSTGHGGNAGHRAAGRHSAGEVATGHSARPGASTGGRAAGNRLRFRRADQNRGQRGGFGLALRHGEGRAGVAGHGDAADGKLGIEGENNVLALAAEAAGKCVARDSETSQPCPLTSGGPIIGLRSSRSGTSLAVRALATSSMFQRAVGLGGSSTVSASVTSWAPIRAQTRMAIICIARGRPIRFERRGRFISGPMPRIRGDFETSPRGCAPFWSGMGKRDAERARKGGTRPFRPRSAPPRAGTRPACEDGHLGSVPAAVPSLARLEGKLLSSGAGHRDWA
ncbi:hypothetical protein ADT71_10240 [Novosphingobium sp. ST904]|nr:hypothetical protein ADT71_10240 [Novosphingobium sp. ST904]